MKFKEGDEVVYVPNGMVYTVGKRRESTPKYNISLYEGETFIAWTTENSIVLKSVWDSPLYKLMKENND